MNIFKRFHLQPQASKVKSLNRMLRTMAHWNDGEAKSPTRNLKCLIFIYKCALTCFAGGLNSREIATTSITSVVLFSAPRKPKIVPHATHHEWSGHGFNLTLMSWDISEMHP